MWSSRDVNVNYKFLTVLLDDPNFSFYRDQCPQHSYKNLIDQTSEFVWTNIICLKHILKSLCNSALRRYISFTKWMAQFVNETMVGLTLSHIKRSFLFVVGRTSFANTCSPNTFEEPWDECWWSICTDGLPVPYSPPCWLSPYLMESGRASRVKGSTDPRWDLVRGIIMITWS